MNRSKLGMVVKGYLLKEKRNTILTSLFLCFITVFLLIGNQLFLNVQMANRANAEALEGKQHVTYFDISEKEFQKIKKFPLAKEVGKSINLGAAEDGTGFSYMDSAFRNLSASVADKNVKQVMDGRWAEKDSEVVFTENYLKKYHLKLGDTVTVNLTASDSNTGDMLFQTNGLTLTIVGVMENVAGFTDRKMGCVSEELANAILKENDARVKAVVRFYQENKIAENIEKLNTYLGYSEEDLEGSIVRENTMLTEAVSDNGHLKNQNRVMNFIIWLVCVMVVYNIFYNRFFSKKRDFINLRKMGFQTRDLLKITVTEFVILILVGFVTGNVIGYVVNQMIYSEIMKSMLPSFDAGSLVSSGLSLQSIKNTLIMLFFVLIPGIASAILQLKTISPVNFMRKKRKNYKKIVISLVIVALSAILISLLSVQDNGSDNGIIYVKTYVPGDLQITSGSIIESMLEGEAPSISQKVLQEMKENPDIKQVQDYEVNYETSTILCEETIALNEEASGYYEMLLEQEREIDGTMQCLYSLTVAATDNMKALVPGYDEEKAEHGVLMEEGLARALNLEVGDSFTLYEEQLMAMDTKKDIKSVTVKLLGTKPDMVLSENHVGPNLLIADRETAEAFGGSLSCQVMNLWVQEGKETEVLTSLKHNPELDGCSLRSAKQQMQEYVDADRNQTVLHYFFLILLALIGILTYFNTVFTNILSRKNDFSIMHKIGIRRTEMRRMVVIEGLLHGILAAIVVAAVQGILCIRWHIMFNMAFVVTDVGMLSICVLFPFFIMLYVQNGNLYSS